MPRRRVEAAVAAGLLAASPAVAAERPSILTNRWQEDWSPLADSTLRTQPLDRLKYIPLGDGESWLTLGGGWRGRFETNHAPLFGTVPGRADSWFISRLEAHADLHAGPLQFFAQLQSDFAPGKRTRGATDSNRLDLEQGFVALVQPLGPGVMKLRVGRQQFAFDLQRFVSVRDGPNVRQSFDAVWGNYEIGRWRFIGYYTRPVATRDDHPFDDKSSRRNRFYGARVERQVLGTNELSAYWSRYTDDEADGGHERRDVWDMRFAGKRGRIDWDMEGMFQHGHVGPLKARAWALAGRGGYSFAEAPWKPRLGLQLDAASGDDDPDDGVLGTFNPLFPNGAYLNLAGYSAYANFIHVKPSVTVAPGGGLTLMGAAAAEWRATRADAIYVQPSNPVPDTAGQGSRWTGAYGQIRADWKTAIPGLTAAVEGVHFRAGDTIRRAGGGDSDYLGVEIKYNW